MSNRLRIQKFQRLQNTKDSKWQLLWLDTFQNAVPAVLQRLQPVGDFLGNISAMFSISPRTTDWLKRYNNINDDSLTNNVNNK
jgi:hypothetical protein